MCKTVRVMYRNISHYVVQYHTINILPWIVMESHVLYMIKTLFLLVILLRIKKKARKELIEFVFVKISDKLLRAQYSVLLIDICLFVWFWFNIFFWTVVIMECITNMYSNINAFEMKLFMLPSGGCAEFNIIALSCFTQGYTYFKIIVWIKRIC